MWVIFKIKLLMIMAILLLTSCKLPFQTSILQSESDLGSATQLKKHIDYLASPDLKGRETGSLGILKAAEYIAKIYKANGLVAVPGFLKVSSSDISAIQTEAGLQSSSSNSYSQVWEFAQVFKVTKSQSSGSSFPSNPGERSGGAPSMGPPMMDPSMMGPPMMDPSMMGPPMMAPSMMGPPMMGPPMSDPDMMTPPAMSPPTSSMPGEGQSSGSGQMSSPPIPEIYIGKHAYNLLGLMKADVSTTRTILIGAHYDHFGPRRNTKVQSFQGPSYLCQASSSSSMGADEEEVCYGADDNGSGVAIMLEAIAALKSLSIKKNIMFVAFGAEELGMLGAKSLITELSAKSILPCHQSSSSGALCLEAMINIDFVGHTNTSQSSLGVLGTQTFAKSLVPVTPSGLKLEDADKSQGNHKAVLTAPSDSQVFAQKGIPTLFFTAQQNSVKTYHTVADLSEKIDYNSFKVVGDFIIDTIKSYSTSSAQITRSSQFAAP